MSRIMVPPELIEMVQYYLFRRINTNINENKFYSNIKWSLKIEKIIEENSILRHLHEII